MKLSYVLITPARNEEASIGKTIESVIGQSRPPKKWIIVSDGSTDGTDDIVKSYLSRYPWIEFVRRPERGDRQFAAKVHCFNAGYGRLKGERYDVIGNLDADISFENDYFEYLLPQFEQNTMLGVAGTPFVEDGKHYDYNFTNIEHVSGACQLFRRECFEEIGGYIPIRGGGIDWVAVTTARMKGWQTRTFTQMVCLHHRKMGTGTASPLQVWYKQGIKDYTFGYHPFWEIFRSLYQMTKRPYLIGGALLLLGYTVSLCKRVGRPIEADLIAFVRKEQMARIMKLLKI